MLSFAPVTFALIAVLPSLVSALFPPAESYAACSNAAPLNYVDPVAVNTLTGGSQGCSPYCANKSYRYAYLSPNAEQCGCSNLGPTAATFATAINSAMRCDPSLWDVRIALTTFSTPTCYTGFAATSDASLRTTPVDVEDVSSCFRTCLQFDGASIIPSLTGASYSCICDSDFGEVDDADRTPCARGSVIRYGSHSPGQRLDPATPPGPSTFVKRQIREQMRLDSQREANLCPQDGKACLVAHGKESWECVDVASELESCGGCMFGEHLNSTAQAGVDCTALPGISMGGVTCTHGQCAIWACDPGFTLSGRECVISK